MNKPFENMTDYALISGYPNIFANNTILNCIIFGWGKNEFGYSKNKANFAAVRVKYGPNACEVPPDKYLNIFTRTTISNSKIT